MTNLAVVGGECGEVLKLRVGDNKLETVFVNFPEPVQQQCNDIDDDENGHMLMKSNLKIIGACLLGNGKGRLVMVSDNLSYTRLIARLLTKFPGTSSVVSTSKSDLTRYSRT